MGGEQKSMVKWLCAIKLKGVTADSKSVLTDLSKTALELEWKGLKRKVWMSSSYASLVIARAATKATAALHM